VSRSRVRKVSLLGALATVGCVVFGVGGATAAGPPPAPGLSAVWQYTEAVPTSKGAALEKGGRATPKKLPAKVATALARSGSPVDRVLRKTATSPAYGAPTGRAKKTKRLRHATRSEQQAPRERTAATRTSSEGFAGDTRFVVLAALMGGGLLLALAFRLLARSRAS
jgi:hypothetical protein